MVCAEVKEEFPEKGVATVEEARVSHMTYHLQYRSCKCSLSGEHFTVNLPWPPLVSLHDVGDPTLQQASISVCLPQLPCRNVLKALSRFLDSM